MDGAPIARKEIITLNVWGVPFDLRSSTHMASLIGGFGSLQSMPNNGLHQGDPNVMHMEVVVLKETIVPLSVAYGLTPGGPMALISVILGSRLMQGQTAASDVHSPKASKGKATMQVPRPTLTADSWSTSVGERQGDIPQEQFPYFPVDLNLIYHYTPQIELISSNW